MPSSIFGSRGGNSVMEAISRMRSLGNASDAYGMLYMSNPNFRKFADSVKGKTPEQAFAEYGIDFSQVRSLIR